MSAASERGDFSQALDGILNAGDGKVCPEKQLTGHSVFVGEAQRVIKLPGTIPQSRNVGIEIWLLADQNDGLLFPRMTEVGNHHPQLGVFQSNIFQQQRIGEL